MTSGVGAKTRSTPAPATDLHVGVEGPRVARQVLARPELQRVEEDRDDDVGGPLPGRLDEGRVALVQGAHRHDHRDVAVGELAPGGAQLVAGPGDRPASAPRRGVPASVTVAPAGAGGIPGCSLTYRSWSVARMSNRGSATCGLSRPLASARSAVARASAT